MSYTATPDPTDASRILLTIDGVTFRVYGADRPGALFSAPWTSQIDQIAAGLAVIPGSLHQFIAPAEIHVEEGAGGCAYSFTTDVIIIRNNRFIAPFNRRTFQSLIHEAGHALDKRCFCTQAIRGRCAAGRAREAAWTASLTAPIANWTPGTSPTFPPAAPPDDWDHFRSIPYRGSNKVPRSGLPAEIDSFAEGFMMYLCRSRSLTADQARIIRTLAGL
jgi:hypothetical protein